MSRAKGLKDNLLGLNFCIQFLTAELMVPPGSECKQYETDYL
jgi:hypothetical protein